MRFFNHRIRPTSAPLNEASELFFLSYAREDRSFAVKLCASLKERSREVWMDTQIPGTAEWEKDIVEKINESTSIIFIISPNSITFDSFCLTELKVATNYGKRLVPILYGTVDHKHVGSTLSKINWIDFTGEDMDKNVENLITALDSDLEYLKQHTYLSLRQSEWMSSDLDANLLLKGTKLHAAEQWLRNVKKDIRPQPTKDQIEYVIRSRTNVTRRQRMLLMAGALILVALAGVGFLFKNWSDSRQISLAKTLARKAESALNTDPELSLSVANRAFETAPTKEAQDALRNAVINSPGKLILRHDKELRDANFSPSGKFAVTAGNDNKARIWDLRTGEMTFSLEHDEPVTVARFDPQNDNTVLTLSDNVAVQLWDASTGKLLYRLADRGCAALQAEFTPDGSSIVTRGEEKICVWKKDPNGKYQYSYMIEKKEREGAFRKIAVNSRYIAAAHASSNFEVRDIANGNFVIKQTSEANKFENIAFCHGVRDLLATSDDNGITQIWDTKNWESVYQIPGRFLIGEEIFKPDVNQHSISPDTRHLVLPSRNGKAAVYDLEGSGGVTEHLGKGGENNKDKITRALFSPDGNTIVTVNDDLSLGVWGKNSANGEAGTFHDFTFKLRGHSARINGVAFSQDSSQIISYGDDNTARIWQIRGNDRFSKLDTGSVFSKGLISLNFSPDGNYMVIGGGNGGLRLWDLSTGESGGPSLPLHQAAIRNAVFSNDGDRILTASDDGVSRIYQWKTGAALREFNIKEQEKPISDDIDEKWRRGIPTPPSSRGSYEIDDAKFSPDGKKVVTASEFVTQLWELETGRRYDLQGINGSHIVLFHPDGRIISDFISRGGLYGGSITISDPTTGQQIRQLSAFEGMLTSMQLSPDGKFLATTSYDGSARVWDMDTYRQVVVVKNHEDASEEKSEGHALRKVSFSPDGRFIATAGNDGTAKVWEVATGRLTASLMGHSMRISDIEYSNDGRFIVTASWDTTAKVWNAETGEMLADFTNSRQELTRAAFYPDNNSVITIGMDNIARVYKRETFVSFDEIKKIAESRLMLDPQNEEFLKIVNE